jgi:uncharacterized Zn finger protein
MPAPLTARAAQLRHDGAISQVTTTYGTIRADVSSGRNNPAHTAELHLPAYSAVQWEKITTALAGRPGLLTALRAGTLPAELADPAHTAGLPLAPAPGEITTGCTCRTPGTACLHAASLAHEVTAQIQQRSGLLLLTLRGLTPARLIARLTPPASPHPHNPSPATRAKTSTPGPRNSPDASAQRPDTFLPSKPDQEFLLTDAALRARQLLDGQPLIADPLIDAVRTLAAPHGQARLTAVASRADRTPAETKHILLAYRHNGPAGAHTAAHPDNSDIDAGLARETLHTVATRRTTGGELRLDNGHITDLGAGIQLRFGPDNRWHPYTTSPTGHFIPAPGADTSATTAYEAARRARRQRGR